VEKGKPVGAVKNLRFTQSVPEAFFNVLIKNFTFTGQTK